MNSEPVRLGEIVHSNRIVVIQIAILAFCALAVFQLATSFPYPSPIVKPFLPPQLRWPTAQVEAWVESGNFDHNFLEYFSRDPQRRVPAGDNTVSPADGVIKTIEVRDGIAYFVVGLSFWDVHVVRTPVAGVVTDIAQEGYTFFDRKADKETLKEQVFLRGKAAPVQQIVTLQTGSGVVKVRLITSYWASRLKLWVHLGQHLAKGDRIGRILLGSTVAAEFPPGVAFSAHPGQRVVAGETVIAGSEARP